MNETTSVVNVEIVLLAAIATYCAGVWVTLLLVGLLGGDKDDAWVASLLWPLFYIVLFAVFINDVTLRCLGWCKSTKAGKVLGKVLTVLSLPLRPFTLGTAIREYRKKRDTTKKLERLFAPAEGRDAK